MLAAPVDVGDREPGEFATDALDGLIPLFVSLERRRPRNRSGRR
jgi:hypothetical protein